MLLLKSERLINKEYFVCNMRWYRWVLLGTIVLILLGLVLAEPVSDVKANPYVTDSANLFSPDEKLAFEGFVHE